MQETFWTEIRIKKVRHLSEISIPLSEISRKHLILTGKNGSGKTSVLNALADHLQYIISDEFEQPNRILTYGTMLNELLDNPDKKNDERKIDAALKKQEILLNKWSSGAVSVCNSFDDMRTKYKEGQFLLAYYGVNRQTQVEEYKNIEKISLKNVYKPTDAPGTKFTKYLVDLKATQAFARGSEKAKKIDEWFENFEQILKRVFQDSTLRLIFDEETFQFSLYEKDREPFDFNTMASGYSAAFDIIDDLIMRMEASKGLRMKFDMEGIVLIDEVETHLHLDLQKEILPILTGIFPNIQFIISTHSPFVLNSLGNAVIYDLEKKLLVPEGLQNLPYEGIVEGYFGADRLSQKLRGKFERYKTLVHKELLSDEEYAEIEELEYYLDEIPDYLAIEIATEYSRMKNEFSTRESLNDKD